MQYFIPEWDDRVDPEYNFLTDEHSEKHNQGPLMNDVYAYEIYGIENAPFDGILVSKTKIMQGKTKYKKILNLGIHEFLRLPKTFPIMGDCGAFGYIKQEKPPFKTKETLEYYVNCGFNIGVSVDHLIVKATEDQKDFRWNLTVENAKKMYDLWKAKDKFFNNIKIIGVAQGWDIDSYHKAVRELLEHGYDYIGLGGLVRSQTKFILDLMRTIHPTLKEFSRKMKNEPKIHLFGLARPKVMKQLQDFGVISVYSSSFLRRSWLGASSNYFSVNGNSYAAIRIPQTDRSPRARKIVKEGKATLEQIQEYEKKCLRSMRDFDKGLVDVDTVLKTILEYDQLIGENRTGFEKYFRKTLEDKPWKKCPCEICKKNGVEVIIFRGNNRNRRRGFHNTWVFYNKIMKSLK